MWNNYGERYAAPCPNVKLISFFTFENEFLFISVGISMCISARGDSSETLRQSKVQCTANGLMVIEVFFTTAEAIKKNFMRSNISQHPIDNNWWSLPIFDTHENRETLIHDSLLVFLRFLTVFHASTLINLLWLFIFFLLPTGRSLRMMDLLFKHAGMAFDRFENYQLFRTKQKYRWWPFCCLRAAVDVRDTIGMSSALSWRHFAINKHHISTLRLRNCILLLRQVAY